MQFVPLRMVGEPPHEPELQPHPFFGRGFRPFFFGASVFAALALMLWLFILSGKMSGPMHHLAGVYWHRHAMIFSFTGAVIVGFLLTAVPNWTGGQALRGKALAVVWGFWLLSVLIPFSPIRMSPIVVSILASLWLWLSAIWVAWAIFTAPKQVKNYFAPLILIAFSLFAFCDYFGLESSFDPALAALDLIVLLMVIIGGRVIPFFSGRAIGGVSIEKSIKLDITLNILLAIGLILHHASPGTLSAILQGIAAILLLVRMMSWHSQKTLLNPMLWVLHIGHALLSVPLFLRSLQLLNIEVPRTVVLHSISMGALSFLVLGMMSRVSLGHSGRPIIAPTGIVISFFLLIPVFLIRVFVPWYDPSLSQLSWHIGGGIWSLIWVYWAFVYSRILFTERPDGRPA